MHIAYCSGSVKRLLQMKYSSAADRLAASRLATQGAAYCRCAPDITAGRDPARVMGLWWTSAATTSSAVVGRADRCVQDEHGRLLPAVMGTNVNFNNQSVDTILSFAPACTNCNSRKPRSVRRYPAAVETMSRSLVGLEGNCTPRGPTRHILLVVVLVGFNSFRDPTSGWCAD